MSTIQGDIAFEGFGLSEEQVDEVRMAVVEACISVVAPPGSAAQDAQIVLKALGSGDTPAGLLVTIRADDADLADGLLAPAGEEDTVAARERRYGLKIIDALMDAVEVRTDGEGVAVVMRKMR